MNDQIKHDGIVDSILDGKHLRVKIVQSSACASCKIASHCTSSESKEKIIDITTRDTSTYAVGEEVIVMTSNKVGATAVTLAFVIPTILVLATVLGIINLLPKEVLGQENAREALAAVAGIIILIPYYIGLYCFRKKLQRTVTFSVQKK